MLMFGGLVPMITVRHGGMREAFMGGNYAGNGLYDNHHVRVLAANGTRNHLDFANAKHFGDGFNNVGETHVDLSKIVYSANSSESLEASLYVPRNDKLVKIDGSLIIHSILASEKALKSSQETGLAIPGDFAPARRNPYTYKGPVEGEGALVPGVVDRDYKWFTSADGRLQQWFQEGLSGSTFSSGMCTEVFQFHASSAIVPVTSSTRNVSIEPAQSTSYKGQQNRRVLRSPLPISASSQNMTEENAGISGPKENISSNRTVPPMVVSVLVDPRDAADGGENMMGKKTLSRIFVVVLIDSVKYVTYSCILPVKGSVRL
ncbi:unnamed protein product [Cuscuta epithymum]|uniref:Uncharacterized protein n=1 Tax=Cuscuta epithymum TaxID=186058 RepID=A0AAV0FHK0_9ASTE|nr:unnamed protein product [Cuscuta epithymum]